MSQIGNNKIIGVSKGDIPIVKIYKGNDIVYQLNTVAWYEKYIVPVEEAKVGDILYSKDEGNQLIVFDQQITDNTSDLRKLQNESYYPIAVVITPGSHDVYGDGSISCMSIHWINPHTIDFYPYPTTSAFDTKNSSYDYGLPKMQGRGTSVVYQMTNGKVGNTFNSFVERPVIATDYNIHGPVSSDGIRQYNPARVTYSELYGPSPSPFNADGSKNEVYWTKYTDGGDTLQTEVWGDANTARLFTLFDDRHILPFASCAKLGTQYNAEETIGKWYLPSQGELGYMFSNFDLINDILYKLSNVSNIKDIIDSDIYSFISSTEWSDGNMGNITNELFLFGPVAKNKEGQVAKAFIRVFPDNTAKQLIVIDWENINSIDIDGQRLTDKSKEYVYVDDIDSITINVDADAEAEITTPDRFKPVISAKVPYVLNILFNSGFSGTIYINGTAISTGSSFYYKGDPWVFGKEKNGSSAWFSGSNTITNLSSINISNGLSYIENASYMFYNLSRLTTVTLSKPAKTVNIAYMFSGCTALASVDLTAWDCKVVGCKRVWENCTALTEVHLGTLDMSEDENNNLYLWYQCTNLTTITGVMKGIHWKMDMSPSPLTADSVMVIINGLEEHDGSDRSNHTLTLSASTYNQLTATQRAQVTSKNWILAYS